MRISRSATVAVSIAAALLVAACGEGDRQTAAPSTSAAQASPGSTATPSTIAAAPLDGSTTSPPTTLPPGSVDISADPVVDTVPGELAERYGLPTPAASIEAVLALPRPVVLAHAGGEDVAPHSTPFAFAHARNDLADVLDLDVQLAADGVLVVQHDATVDRTTNGTGEVADMTSDELAALDNAYWFTRDCVCTGRPEAEYVYRGMRTGDRPPPPGFTADDFRIPRFREIVERWPDVPLNIEIKGTGAPAIAAAEVLARDLAELDRLDSAVVTSFDDTVVDAFAELAPDVELTPGLGLSTAWVLDRTPLPDGMRILQLPIEYEGLEVITPELIADSHAAGYVIWVWPNDRSWENLDGYRRLLDMGLDGLNANVPWEAFTAVSMSIGAYG